MRKIKSLVIYGQYIKNKKKLICSVKNINNIFVFLIKMKLENLLATICDRICHSDNGNLTEHIIQNILLSKLLKVGLYCQKEVVMPVIMDGIFVGHNRFDIMITENIGKHQIISILEIKMLSQDIQNSKTKQRIFEQCLGYRNCVRNMTTHVDAKINIFLVNIWKKRSSLNMITPYRYDIINVAELESAKKSFELEKTPIPIKIKNVKYFEIESLLKSSTSRLQNKKVLVKWVGVSKPSWEPIQNIPITIKTQFKHILQNVGIKKRINVRSDYAASDLRDDAICKQRRTRTTPKNA